jgi:uncharacterized membrane protein
MSPHPEPVVLVARIGHLNATDLTMTMIATASKAPNTAGNHASRRAGVLPAILLVGAGGVLLSPAGAGLRAAAGHLHMHAPDAGLWMMQPTIIQIHVLAALAALLVGTLLMALRKGAGFHRAAGWSWVSLMALVAGSSLFITGFNGDRWSAIHLLSGWTLLMLPLAVMFAKRRNIKRHRRAMMGLFYFGPVLAGALTFIPGRLMWNLIFG